MPESSIGFYGHVKQYHNLKAEIDQAILDVLESGSYVLGPQLAKFEEELARYMNVRETVGVNSGTDALLLVFLALGLGPGDEIITTSNTFFATAEAIWLAGATPVFVDSDPKTRNIDVTKIEAAITSKTRAIVPVHLYGLTANMPEIAKIAKAHDLFVVEDCAQAIGARGDQFAIGELSDAVCLSFIIQKNLGCFGDGGAVATNNKDLAANYPQAAQPRLFEALLSQYRLQQPSGRYSRGGVAGQTEARGRMERKASADCETLRPGPGRSADDSAIHAAWLRACLPSLRGRER